MALRKVLDVAGTGHADEYWRVTRVVLDMSNPEGAVLAVQLSGYKDEQHRRNGFAPHATAEFRWSQEVLPFPIHNPTLEAIYARIKADPKQRQWADAEDLLNAPAEEPGGEQPGGGRTEAPGVSSVRLRE